jgi:hypothetical protein
MHPIVDIVYSRKKSMGTIKKQSYSNKCKCNECPVVTQDFFNPNAKEARIDLPLLCCLHDEKTMSALKKDLTKSCICQNCSVWYEQEFNKDYLCLNNENNPRKN